MRASRARSLPEQTGCNHDTDWSCGQQVLVAFILGFLSCFGWLGWSADDQGEHRGPGLPAPTQFPARQIIACALTVIVTCFLAAYFSRWIITGGLAARWA